MRPRPNSLASSPSPALFENLYISPGSFFTTNSCFLFLQHTELGDACPSCLEDTSNQQPVEYFQIKHANAPSIANHVFYVRLHLTNKLLLNQPACPAERPSAALPRDNQALPRTCVRNGDHQSRCLARRPSTLAFRPRNHTAHIAGTSCASG
uniref:Uncharacterized protein n=1 Tax=Bionectria ochroleuca TaxID=29856 RepID=A0A8H7N0B6_BIOOC